jgi:hypothetical protein
MSVRMLWIQLQLCPALLRCLGDTVAVCTACILWLKFSRIKSLFVVLCFALGGG